MQADASNRSASGTIRLALEDESRAQNPRYKKSAPALSLAALLERVPPHDEMAEASVLGAMMTDARAASIAVEDLSERDFYVGRHKTLFGALRKYFAQTENLDLVVVKNFLKRDGILEDIGGMDELARLYETPSSSASIESYCKLVREFAIQRELLEAAAKILMNVQDPGGKDCAALVDIAEKLVYDISDNRKKEEAVSITAVLESLSERAETAQVILRAGGELVSQALPTRFSELDNLLAGGLWPSELVIIAGRPSMGKTTLALNIARKIAADHEQKRKAVAIFSLEMPSEQIGKNILCAEAHVDGKRMRNFNFDENEYAEVVSASRVLQQSPIHIDDTSGLTVEQLRARCRRLKHRENVSLVVVDYLQLMRPSEGSERASRQEQVSEISRGLKSIARELRLPVIVLSQLNRSMEKKDGDDKRPALSDLRDSGAIEQDADVVIMLYRQEYYDLEQNTNHVNIGEALIQKNRNGQVGKVKLTFFKNELRFETYSSEHDALAGGV